MSDNEENAASLFNNKRLEDVTEGDKEFTEELVLTYKEEYPKSIDGLKDAYKKKNADQIKFHAHTIKGASQNLGADKVGVICKKMEFAAKDGKLEEAWSHFGRLETVLAQTIAAIDNYVDSL